MLLWIARGVMLALMAAVAGGGALATGGGLTEMFYGAVAAVGLFSLLVVVAALIGRLFFR